MTKYVIKRVQFGYEDRTEAGVKIYREEWIKGGAKWLREDLKPPNWSLKEQLLRINIKLEDFMN